MNPQGGNHASIIRPSLEMKRNTDAKDASRLPQAVSAFGNRADSSLLVELTGCGGAGALPKSSTDEVLTDDPMAPTNDPAAGKKTPGQS